MDYFAEGSAEAVLDESHAGELIDRLLDQLGRLERVLLIPPDITRLHSWAGTITRLLYERLQSARELAILPAIGTHTPMTADEIESMYPGVPSELFRAHDWRNDLITLGEIPAEFLHEVSEGKFADSIRIEVNRLLVEGNWDRIISIGQLVPHEVIGIANHNKNIFIGTGGVDTINKSHFLGAVYGMERIMGRADTPVRRVLDRASQTLAGDLPILYLLSVRARDATGKLVTRGLFSGDDRTCFLRGAELCRAVNLDVIGEPWQKVVVSLDPQEFKSTWLGNKAIYRTRMAIANAGELIVLAPGVREFGEDRRIDDLIRRFGYRGTPHTLEQVKRHAELQENLSAAAHLIHGSSEGRFAITYCPGGLSRAEIDGVGYRYGDLDQMAARYLPDGRSDGFHTTADGERFYFISNPALGLWGTHSALA